MIGSLNIQFNIFACIQGIPAGIGTTPRGSTSGPSRAGASDGFTQLNVSVYTFCLDASRLSCICMRT
jgi:hypothetical protein